MSSEHNSDGGLLAGVANQPNPIFNLHENLENALNIAVNRKMTLVAQYLYCLKTIRGLYVD